MCKHSSNTRKCTYRVCAHSSNPRICHKYTQKHIHQLTHAHQTHSVRARLSCNGACHTHTPIHQVTRARARPRALSFALTFALALALSRSHSLARSRSLYRENGLSSLKFFETAQTIYEVKDFAFSYILVVCFASLRGELVKILPMF